MSSTALNTYKKVGIESKVLAATPAKLIELLFDGAVNAITHAKTAMSDGNMAETGRLVSKAATIVSEGLMGGLKMEEGGSLAGNLASLYEYIVRLLLKSQLEKNPDGLEEAKRLLLELREAWSEAVVGAELKAA